MGPVVVVTAVKQVAITSVAHMSNLGKYLNDERAVARGSQNLVDPGNWEREFERTRAAYGHDGPSRAGAANTVAYHRVLAFNPDECDMNGGPMSAARCMEYAERYAAKYLPNQECAWVLHRERCDADKTQRYAVHMAVNRTDLETGRRFNMGRSKQAKIERANQVRDLDREFGLRQLEAGRRNSRVHARQPSREEKAMEARGVRTDKRYIREAVKASVAEVVAEPAGGNRMRELSARLERKGVSMTVSKGGGDLKFTRLSTGLAVNGTKLGRGFSMEGIARGLSVGVARAAAREVERAVDQGMEL